MPNGFAFFPPPLHATAGLLLLLAGVIPTQAKIPTDKISDLANGYVQSGTVPGIIVGIWGPAGDFTLIRHGTADIATGAPMARANTQRIGSITKSFTVTRLLQLADEGKLSLDDPIDKYVPGLRNGDATLRELANMTSGIFNYTEDQPFIIDFVFHPTKTWTDRQIVAVANRHKPYFKPGDGWHYSNTNTVLLGMVIERVTGNPLRTEITRHLIRPLGLDHTSYPTGVFLPSPFTHGYATLDADVGRVDLTESSPSGSSGAGAMISTLDDIHIWGRSLARGSLISRSAQLERLRMVDSASGVGPFYDRYGLALGRIDGWIGHTADILGYQSLVMHNLVADETVVIFVNASNPDHIPTELFQKMTPLLASAIPSRSTTLRVAGRRHRSTSASVVTLRGRAGSAAGILGVQVASGSRSWRLASGRESWSAKVRLHPGRNAISLRAADRLGRRSKVVQITIDRR
ncbi:MAG TPA: serine hydrolase domain-containing protein [Chthoniobacterales bacterium]